MNAHLQTLLAKRNTGMTASDIREILKVIKNSDIISFAGGIPDPELFPKVPLAEAFDKVFSDSKGFSDALQYSVTEGNPQLRSWISQYMEQRGVRVTPDNVLITSGSQQALDLIAKVFLDPGDTVLVTRPTYLGAIQAFNAYQPRYVDVEMDNDGPTAKGLVKAFEQKPKIVYIVPDFQNPAGISLSIERRQLLAKLGKEHKVPIVEDSPYEQLYFEANPYPPVIAFMHGQSCGLGIPYDSCDAPVIYCGTFSKTLAPGLRVGWAVAPESVIRRLVLAKQAADLHSNTLGQIVTYEVVTRCYAEHTARLRIAYKGKRDAMLAALDKYFGGKITWTRPTGGMFIWLEYPDSVDTRQLLQIAIEQAKVAFVPGHAFFAKNDKTNTCRFSYSCPSPVEITKGIERLARLNTRNGTMQ